MSESLFVFRNVEFEGKHFLVQLSAYARQFRSKLGKLLRNNGFSRENLKETLRHLHSIHHLRCQALELFIEDELPLSFDPLFSICGIFESLSFIDEPQFREKVKSLLNRLPPILLNVLIVIWQDYWKNVQAKDHIYWKSVSPRQEPWFYFQTHDFLEKPKNYYEKTDVVLTSSQQRAFDELHELYRAKALGLKAAGIEPSKHALLVGSSGSGKSFLIRAFARKYGLPLFEISLGAWLLVGGRGEVPTLRRLANWIKKEEKGIICFEEIEKLRPKSDHAEYTRYVVDELMSLLDFRMAHVEGWSEETVSLLKNCFIICVAAFQELYNEKLGGKVCFNEQWESLSIRERILEGTWLPDELIYRLSSKLIEIQPPSLDEISQKLHHIHTDLNLPLLTEDQFQQKAQKLLRGKKNMRGLEEYILDEWMKSQSKISP